MPRSVRWICLCCRAGQELLVLQYPSRFRYIYRELQCTLSRLSFRVVRQRRPELFWLHCPRTSAVGYLEWLPTHEHAHARIDSRNIYQSGPSHFGRCSRLSYNDELISDAFSDSNQHSVEDHDDNIDAHYICYVDAYSNPVGDDADRSNHDAYYYAYRSTGGHADHRPR